VDAVIWVITAVALLVLVEIGREMRE